MSSSNSKAVIRRARPGDREALGRYGGALMRQHLAFDAERFIRVDHPEKGYGRFLVSELSDRRMVVFVAELDGEVVGYVYAGIEPLSWKELRAKCGFIHDVYVDESARGCGIGEDLVRAAIEWLDAKGMPRTVLWSAAKNAPAQHVFERLGFRRTMVEMTRESGRPAPKRRRSSASRGARATAKR